MKGAGLNKIKKRKERKNQRKKKNNNIKGTHSFSFFFMIRIINLPWTFYHFPWGTTFYLSRPFFFCCSTCTSICVTPWHVSPYSHHVTLSPNFLFSFFFRKWKMLHCCRTYISFVKMYLVLPTNRKKKHSIFSYFR